MNRHTVKLTLLVIALLLCSRTIAQTVPATIALTDLEAPSSPAFVLLDAAPSSVERPMTSKAFTTSILSLINQNGGAIEVTPYWFIKNKKMTSYRFYGVNPNDSSQNVLAQSRLFSLSLAMVNQSVAGSSSTLNVSNLSFGIRTQLVQIRSKESTGRFRSSHRAMNQCLSNVLDQITLVDPNAPNRNAIINDIVRNDTSLAKARENFSKVLTEKPTFTLELAAGYNLAFDSSDFKSGRTGRLGAWLNADYIVYHKNSTYLHLTGLARYLYDKNSKDGNGTYLKNDCLDWGGKVELELGKLSSAFEYVKRNNLTQSKLNTERIAGTVRYKVSNDLYVNGTLGNNFGKNSLLTLFGFQWSIGNGNEKVE